MANPLRAMSRLLDASAFQGSRSGLVPVSHTGKASSVPAGFGTAGGTHRLFLLTDQCKALRLRRKSFAPKAQKLYWGCSAMPARFGASPAAFWVNTTPCLAVKILAPCAGAHLAEEVQRARGGRLLVRIQEEERQLVILQRQAVIVHPRLCFLSLLLFT